MFGPLALALACAPSESQLSAVGRAHTETENVGEPGLAEQYEAPTRDLALAMEAPPDRPGSQCGTALFAEGTIQDLHLQLSDAALDALRNAPTEGVAGDVSWQGRQYGAAVRLKGSSSFRTIDEKPSFKVDVHEWARDERLDGCKRLTLNNMVQDPTMLREHAYYWLAAQLGVVAPRHGYARVWVNGAAYGLYGIVETQDEQFVDRAYPGDSKGNLYESSGADFTRLLDWFALDETGDVLPSPDDVDDVVAAVEGATPDTFYSVLQARFDADEVLTYEALDTVAGNDDGYVFNHHNYHAYHGVESGRWSLIPWGTDRSFSRTPPPQGDTTTPVVGTLTLQCWASVDCAAALRSRILAVLDVWEGDLPAYIDAAAATIAPACADDPRKEYSCQPEKLSHFVRDRAAAIRAAL